MVWEVSLLPRDVISSMLCGLLQAVHGLQHLHSQAQVCIDVLAACCSVHEVHLCWRGMLSLIYIACFTGEYPLASSSASERAEANKALRFRRGEMVVCTFTMQVS